MAGQSFDFYQAKIRTKARIVKFARFWFFRVFVFLIYSLAVFSIALILLKSFEVLVLEALEFVFSSFLILFSIVFLSFHIYYEGEIKKPRLYLSLREALLRIKARKKINLADFLTIDSYLAIDQALKLNAEKYPLVDNKALILALLKSGQTKDILLRMGIKPDRFFTGIEKRYPRGGVIRDDEMQNLDSFLERAAQIALAELHERIEIGDLLTVLAILDPYFSRVLFDLNLKTEDVLNITYWYSSFLKERERKKFNPDYLKLTGGIGRDWGAGYVPYLTQFAFDLTDEVRKLRQPLHLIGHERQTEELSKIMLRATHHNVLLVGEPGVGKKTIILGLAKAIYEGRAFSILRNRHLMQLNLDLVLAGAATPGEIISRLQAVFEDAVRAGNIILFIDRIEALFGGSVSEVVAIDASQVIIPYLEIPDLYFIGTTTLADFHQHIETKPGVVERFEKIEVKEPDRQTVLRILQDLSPQIEKRQGVIFSYEALISIYNLADQYIYNKYFPEKAVDLLDEVAVYARGEGRGVLVASRHVEEVMGTMTGIPIGEAKEAERKKLLKLEEFLHERVIGQDEAINLIANAMRRARAGVGVGKKPIGSFLFLGPTGVGKTETCKALAEAYFGKEEAMIRFDMSEYQDIASIYRLIGAPPGSPEAGAGGLLTNAVKDRPFSLILFDEIEKAHPDILNLFLQVLDEGWLTDSLGRRVKFNNTIIIGTSNAGANLIQECVKEGIPFEEMKKSLWNFLIQKGIFRPEFLNRFNAVVTFKPLTEEEVAEITDLLIRKLTKKLEEEKGIFLRVEEKAVIALAKLGFDPLLGARPISRVIEKKIEDILAKLMLEGKLKRGSSLVIREQDIL